MKSIKNWVKVAVLNFKENFWYVQNEGNETFLGPKLILFHFSLHLFIRFFWTYTCALKSALKWFFFYFSGKSLVRPQ